MNAIPSAYWGVDQKHIDTNWLLSEYELTRRNEMNREIIVTVLLSEAGDT